MAIQTLATGFVVAGAALSLPSAGVLIYYGIQSVRLRFAPAPVPGTGFGDNPDAMLLMVKGIAKAVGGLGSLAGALGSLALAGLAFVAVVGLILGLSLWCTGRGLHAGASWARMAAGALIALALVPALLLTLSLHGIGRVLMLAVVTLCVLGLHALWVGYAPGTA